MAWIRDAAEWLWAISPVKYTIISIVRLGLAALLGGIIGYEREHSHRPAGFRTHILVAVGAAVVMLTAVYMTERYPDKLDMSRMPAQVVSGIGFLGAGTILREGFSVKGLTTAASLWAVSCVGLAVGSRLLCRRTCRNLCNISHPEFSQKGRRKRPRRKSTLYRG